MQMRLRSILLGVLAVGLTECGASRAQVIGAPHAPFFNVLEYGAHNDGSASATDAFRKAIQAAHKAGGGTVYVPPGHYVTGPIQMVSNLTLFFDSGAVVRFPATILPLTPGRQQGIETLTPIPLIGGHDLKNVSVIGHGVLTTNNADWMKLHTRALRSVDDAGSANGENWERLLKDLEAQHPISDQEYKDAASELRPSFVRFMNSKNIRIDGLRFIGSSMWTVHLLYSENAVVENLVIEAYPGVHGDGIVVDSSRFVRIANNYIDAGDDGLVIKAGKDRDGLRVNRPSENVTITDCTVHHAQAALAIGSETSGSVRNVVVSNITAKNTVNGIHIKSRRGRGGTVENVRFENWIMENVGQAITISDAGYQMEGEAPDPGQGSVTQRTPIFRNIAVSHVSIHGAQGLITITGIPEMPAASIRIDDVTGTGRRGMSAEYTDDLELHNVLLNVEAGPVFQIAHSANVELDHVSTRKPLPNAPLIRLEEAPGTIVRDSKAHPGSGVFVSTHAGEFHDVVLVNDSTAGAKTEHAEGEPSWPKDAEVTKEACLVRFDLDREYPAGLGDDAKLCLDLLAAQLKRNPKLSLVLVGNNATRETPWGHVGATASEAAARARNSRDYLVHQAGISQDRIRIFTGDTATDGSDDIDKIESQMVAGTIVEGNVESILVPNGAVLSYGHLEAVP